MIWSIQNTGQLNAIEEIDRTRSDRVVGIVCGAIVEQRLEISLKHRLCPHDHVQKRLFKPSGPLGAFKNKIDLGLLLYMYEKPLWLALTSICDIRNAFAHNLEQNFSNGDADFRAAMKHLKLHQGAKFYPNPFVWSDTTEKIRKPTTNRQIFTTNVKLVLIALLRDMLVHLPQSNQAVIPIMSDEPIELPTLPEGTGYVGPIRRRKKTG
jgi:hypothetical protein